MAEEESDFEILYLERMKTVKYEIGYNTNKERVRSKSKSRSRSKIHISTINDTTTTISASNDTYTTNGTSAINDTAATNDIPALSGISPTNHIPALSGISPINDISDISYDPPYSNDTDSNISTSPSTIDSSVTTVSSRTSEVTESVQAGADDGTKTEEKGSGGKYTIPKVQIKPGRNLSDPNQDELSANYLSRLPVLREQAAPYTPMPYVFRVNADCNRIKIQNMWGRCPPFHLLFDHTIAVIWLLFADKEYDCPLGISQLQWALAFLKTIHTRQGDHPKDVQTCINAIENILLEQYASLTSDLMGVTKLDETVHYIDGALGSQSMVVKSIPFSLNYEEMINKCPAAVGGKDSKLSMTSAEAKEELENIKKAAGVRSIESLDSASKHKAINVLKAWKSEQLEKIRGELRRLRSIEDKMKDIDDNFEGYLEDDLEMLYPQ